MLREKSNIDETIWVKQLIKGNQLAFSFLYNKYAEQTYLLSLKYLGNKALAEDAVQNLFLKIWIKREEIDENKPFNRFLFTILKNDLLNVIRDKKKEIFVLENCLEIILNTNTEKYEYEEDEKYEYQLGILEKAVKGLSEQRKKIFMLKHQEKYTNQEIADLLNLSINTIKHQYYQSLKQIRSYITEIALLILFKGLF